VVGMFEEAGKVIALTARASEDEMTGNSVDNTTGDNTTVA